MRATMIAFLLLPCAPAAQAQILVLAALLTPSRTPDPGPAWAVVSDNDGIAVYKRKVPGSRAMAFRGQAVLDAPMAKVLGVLTDTPRKTEWMDRLMDARDLRRPSETERIQYNRTSIPWPFKDRDFVLLAAAEVKKPRGILIRMKSIQDPLMPENSLTVRGFIHESLCELLPTDNGLRTFVALEIHADLGGWLPLWVVNYANQQWPRMTLAGLRAQASKKEVAEYPGLERWLDRE